MSARAIANIIQTTRSSVNSLLYAHPEDFIKDDSYVPLWRLAEDSYSDFEETDPIMLKLQNRTESKEFTQEYFDSLADWKYGEAFIGKYQYKTKSGNIIECDSKSEIKLLEYLENNKLVKDIGGQMLNIKYDSAFRTDLDYFPDIVALTRDNRIAVFEVKPATAMDNHKNMEKYQSLSLYCQKYGFMYAMIDPECNFSTFEEIRDMSVCSDLLNMFEEWNEEPNTKTRSYKSFDNDDVEEWYEMYGTGYTKKDFALQVHSLIMYYEWYNFYTHGFMAYANKKYVYKHR